MKDIPGFPGYKISEDGKLYNPRGKLIVRKDSWQGYPRARLKNEEGKFVNRKVHTLVALAHLGEGKEVRHLDNNRANFHLHNLEWGDRDSNAADRLARGSYHLKTQLVKGKSLLILGDNKFLDPEAKKVYHVTDHPIGEEGVISIDSLEKVAARYKDSVRRNFVSKHLLDKANKGHPLALSLLKEHETAILGTNKQRLSEYLDSAGFQKKAEWTSKDNADKHALKHADKMGLTKEQYIALAKSALKDKKALINIRGDVHKSRHGKNILIHKDDKVISYFSKTAYLHKVRKHVVRAH